MDWNAVLEGLDQSIKNRALLNRNANTDALNILETTQNMRNQNRAADRLELSQAAQQKYYEGLVDAKQRATDQIVNDKAQADALLEQYNAATEPAEKKALAAALTRYKIRLPEMAATAAQNPVFMLKGDGSVQKLDVPDGAKVIKAGMDQEGYIPDEKTMDDAIDAMRAGNATLWSNLIARGGAGNKTREALAKRYAETRPEDFGGVVATKAGVKAESGTLDALTKSVATQTALHEAALKNFDVMKKTMANIPDLNAPWLNVAPRYIDKKLLDPAAMAAFNMARVSALREYERLVTSNLDAKGQITDAARAAYDHLLDEDTPMSSAIAMIDVMNRDMTNLQGSMQNQKAEAEKQLKTLGQSKPAGTTTPTADGAVANPPAAVGAPVEKQFAKFPPFQPGAPGSKGSASAAAVKALASKFGATDEEAKAYLIAIGYAVK